MFFVIALPYLSGPKAARIISFLRAYRLVIAFLLILAYTGPQLIYPDDLGRSTDAVLISLNLIGIATQVYWIRRVRDLGKRLIASKRWRKALGTSGLIFYFFLLAFNIFIGESENMGTHLTIQDALLWAPISVWFMGSALGLLVVIVLWIADRVARAVSWTFKKLIMPRRPELPSPGRRWFLQQTATALSAAPFVAGAYGLLYGRLNLETIHQRVKLRRLPKPFDGLRIVQLSDIHISPFMDASEVRKYVAIANQLKPDLIALTGDYLTWDAAVQGEVVELLAKLKAPLGVYGCLGNHEILTQAESSITRLFAVRGIHILRQARLPVQMGGEALNLIGVDFQHGWDPNLPPSAYLRGVEHLIMPDTANILFSHNPNSFDRAAELGIDLSLAGHTHGGQVSLKFINPNLTPSRFITCYDHGRFEKDGAQLYVNRGIGTVGTPIRLGAPPEITLFELTREGSATRGTLPASTTITHKRDVVQKE